MKQGDLKFAPFGLGYVGLPLAAEFENCRPVNAFDINAKRVDELQGGRRINDTTIAHVADWVIKLTPCLEINTLYAWMLFLGLPFKEYCPDTCNSKVINLINSSSEYKCRVDVYDPQIDSDHMPENFNGTIVPPPINSAYDALLLAVAHDEFVQMGTERLRLCGKKIAYCLI